MGPVQEELSYIVTGVVPLCVSGFEISEKCSGSVPLSAHESVQFSDPRCWEARHYILEKDL